MLATNQRPPHTCDFLLRGHVIPKELRHWPGAWMSVVHVVTLTRKISRSGLPGPRHDFSKATSRLWIGGMDHTAPSDGGEQQETNKRDHQMLEVEDEDQRQERIRTYLPMAIRAAYVRLCT